MFEISLTARKIEDVGSRKRIKILVRMGIPKVLNRRNKLKLFFYVKISISMLIVSRCARCGFLKFHFLNIFSIFFQYFCLCLTK